MILMIIFMAAAFVIFTGLPLLIFRSMLFGTQNNAGIASAVRNAAADAVKSTVADLLREPERIEAWLRGNNFVDSTAETIGNAVQTAIDNRLPAMISGFVAKPAASMVSNVVGKELDVYISGAMHKKLIDMSDEVPDKLADSIRQIDNEEMKDFYHENLKNGFKKACVYLMLYALIAGVLFGVGLGYAMGLRF